MLLAIPAIKVSVAVVVAAVTLVGHEGLVRTPYYDSVGIRTVCLGETKGVEEREYSETECISMAAERLARDYEQPSRECTGSEAWDALPLPTTSASLSFIWNIGVNGYCRHSTTRRMFSEGRVKEGCEAMLKWNKARVRNKDGSCKGGVAKDGRCNLVELKGLTKRRMEERDQCLEGAV